METLYFYDGLQDVRFVGIDRSGSIGSGLTELLIDGKAPDAPWLTHPRGTVWQGQPELTIGGESEPLSGVRLFNNEILAQTTTANANGDWTANLTLAEGSHLLQATAVDGAGNVSGWSNGATVKVDLTAPTVTLQATASGRNIRLTWSGNDGNGSGVVAYAVQAQINGQAWIDWLPATVETQGIYPGSVGNTYTFRVQAMDAVGRLSDWVQSESIKIERVVTKYYFLGNQRVAMRQGDEVYYLHGDHLGSVSLVTDSEGQVVSEARYTPYGRLRDGSTGPTDIGFTDQRYEAGFGLNDYKARFYSPVLGRFISPDTIVPDPTNLNTLNRYAYVNNNPINLVDPSGHSCVGAQCPPIPLSDLAKIAGPLTVSAPEAAPIAASVGAAAIMAGGAYVGSEWALQDMGPENPVNPWTSPRLETFPAETEGTTISVTPPFPGTSTLGTEMPRIDIFPAENEQKTFALEFPFLDSSELPNTNTLPNKVIQLPGTNILQSRVIQTGGHIIQPWTALILNKYYDMNLHPREWGRALEALKKGMELPDNHHGKIWDDGTYTDDEGNEFGNLLDYLP